MARFFKFTGLPYEPWSKLLERRVCRDHMASYSRALRSKESWPRLRILRSMAGMYCIDTIVLLRYPDPICSFFFGLAMELGWDLWHGTPKRNYKMEVQEICTYFIL